MQNKDKQAHIEVIRQKAQKKAAEFADLFESEIGKSVFKEIKEQFDGSFLVCDNQHETVVRAAQRDVIRWVEEIIDRGNRGEA